MKNSIFKSIIAITSLTLLLLTGTLQAAEKIVEVNLPSIQCGMCIRTIEEALVKVEGVINADVDIENKKVIVTYDDTKTDLKSIEHGITAAGYDANDKKADKEAYKKLGNCCRLPENR